MFVFQEPHRYEGDAGYRQAFLDGVLEYNHFGAAALNKRYQIEEAEALTLFGFKVSGAHTGLS